MSLRSLNLVAALLAFLLALNVNAAGAARDRKHPTTPTSLRITATGPTSISLA